MKAEVSLQVTATYIKIYINGIIHIQLPYFKEIVLQSWKQGKNWYCICFYDKEGNELTESWYKEREVWEQILKLWDENIY